MNKARLFYIVTLYCCLPIGFLFAQNDSSFDKKWENMHDRIEYRKSSQPDGPKNTYAYPPRIDRNASGASQSLTPTNKPADDDIIYSREKRYNNSDDAGVEKRMKEGESDELDDLSTPESEAPDIDTPDWDGPDWDWGDGTFFKYLLILILIVVAVLLIYHFFLKNPTKKNATISSPVYKNEENINPQTIAKSQLEIDLENAIREEDYRLAVRIYYLSVLKQLIQNDWIKWKKKKTNYHYLLEMNQRQSFDSFKQCVDIYEWVWYGKNNPTVAHFELFSAHFKSTINDMQA